MLGWAGLGSFVADTSQMIHSWPLLIHLGTQIETHRTVFVSPASRETLLVPMRVLLLGVGTVAGLQTQNRTVALTAGTKPEFVTEARM